MKAAATLVVAALLARAPMTTTLEALRTTSAFTVEVAGERQAGAPKGSKALLVEWAWGSLGADGAFAEWSSWASDDDVRLATPKGELTLSPARLRLYLAPRHEARYDATTIAKAPPFARGWLADHEGPLTVRAWTLEPGTRYHARVAVESYWLPPRGPEGEPESREALVLWLSDVPFRDGQAARPLTPRGRSHRY